MTTENHQSSSPPDLVRQLNLTLEQRTWDNLIRLASAAILAFFLSAVLWGVATVTAAHLGAAAGERAIDRQAYWTQELTKETLQRLHGGSGRQD